ncbi:heparan-alpha-glucosaminide N-acetyltransferase [Rhodnius prolixus]|uniref:heparan-alpha-glucosaminide N-acetyltransferase n=1 Tax=Rhodnius prolixus TaxID=13249 RepID=UPI003D187857
MSWLENPGRYFGSYDLTELNVDEAYLNITTDSPVYLYGLTDECYRCPFTYINKFDGSSILKVSTVNKLYWRLYKNVTSKIIDENNQDYICEVRPKNFGEFGVYELEQNNNTCILTTVKDPVNIYLSLLIIILCLFTLALFYSIVCCTRHLCKKHKGDEEGQIETVKNKRVTAIDTFRGLCIVLMIFVNDGAGGYSILQHTTWNGLHLADLLFPWFMWIMGVCIPISVKSQLNKEITRLKILSSVLRRSVLLFLLGIALNTVDVGPELSTLRIFGVLQRFSISYFITAVLVTLFMLNSNVKKLKGSEDLINLSLIWIIMIFIVAVHLYLTFYFPLPGCPTGYIGPGGIHYNGIYQNCTGGITGYVDKLVLGMNHIYHNPTSKLIYKSLPFDPEGIFGCLLATFQVFLGVIAGCIIITYPEWKQRMKRWLIWGAIFGIAGLVLCQARQEGGWIPLNKNLWSLSYVAVTSSLGFFILTIFNFIIDEQNLWSGAPFKYPGMNAILLYVGHELCWNLFPWHFRYGRMNTHLILTVEAIWGTFLWILISYWMHKNKFYLAL